MNKLHKQVLVLGNYRQTLTVIRSLARAGYHVIAGREGKRSFTDYSRYTAESWQHPKIKGEESSFLAALDAFLVNRDVEPLIFPIGDDQVSCIARNLGQLPSSVVVVMPDPAIAVKCQDKSHIYKANEALGIPQPAFAQACSYSELEAIVERIGYPCVIKPNDSMTPFFGGKAIIVNSLARLRASMPRWPKGNDHLLVQQFASGDRHTCLFIAFRGQILSYFEYEIVRTDRRDGTGYMVEGVSVKPTTRLRQYSQALVEYLEYSGVGSTQFLVDEETGSVRFLEINPRLSGSCALAFYCGCDFSLMAVESAEYAVGKRSELPRETSDYPVGKHFVWLWGDIRAFLSDVRARKPPSVRVRLQEMVTTLLRGDFHATWWWQDPLPTFVIYGQLLSSLLRNAAVRAFKKRNSNRQAY